MNIDTNFRYVRVEELETAHAAIERAIDFALTAQNGDGMEQLEEANALMLDLKTASALITEMLKRPE